MSDNFTLHCDYQFFKLAFSFKITQYTQLAATMFRSHSGGKKSGGRLHPAQLHSPSSGILYSVDHAEKCPEAETTQFYSCKKYK